ncbi:MAG: hypothetical protein ACTSU5_09400 [Promethearchaeota archaeon]
MSNTETPRDSQPPPPRRLAARLFWILFVLSRILVIVIPAGFPIDVREFIQYGDAFISSANPYDEYTLDSQGYLVAKYPPLYLLQSAGIQFLFGRTSAGMKTGFFLYDLGIAVVLYRLALFLKSEKRWGERAPDPLTVVMVYAFSPVTLIVGLGLPQKFLAQLPLVLGLYAFSRDKDYRTGIFFSLGFLTEIYPVFCLIPVLAFQISRKEWKRVGVVVGSFTAVFLATSVPFILLDATTFWFSFLTQFSRVPQSLSLWIAIPIAKSFSLDLLGLVQVGMTGLVMVGLVLAYSASCLVFFFKNEGASKLSVFSLVLVFFFLLPLAQLTLNFRNFFWLLPTCSLLVVVDLNYKKVLGICVATTAVLGAFLTYAVLAYPGESFVDLLAISNQDLWDWYNSTKVVYFYLVIALSIVWVPFFKRVNIQGKGRVNLSVVNYLNVFLILFWIHVVDLVVLPLNDQTYFTAFYVFFAGGGLIVYIVYFLVREQLPVFTPGAQGELSSYFVN